MKKTCIIVLFIISLCVILAKVQQGKWDKYYHNKLNTPPRELLVKALQFFDTPGCAIDIGCGVGNEAVYMANAGWHVWAVDAEPYAIELLQQRKDISNPSYLTAAVADFEKNTTWDLLPQADLINASYALPFCNNLHFKNTWASIEHKLKPGGRFVGQFFGTKYKGFTEQEKKQMTFLKHDDVLQLFQDFDIEYFQEMENNDISGTGQVIYSHIFDVIAKKKHNLNE
jgi:SAM-dependent methyltransferase